MSGTGIVAVFASPFFGEIDDLDGPRMTSIVQKALALPNIVGTYTEAMQIAPKTLDDGRPLANVSLWLVRCPNSTVVNAIDAVDNVWRIWDGHTEQQRTSLASTLRGYGCDTTFSLSETTKEMAGRVAIAINPDFPGWPPGWFD